MIIDSTQASSTAASGTAAADKAKLETDINKFLTLLLTQLKNQDPTEPLDANEFTAQLVQFASVEQQLKQSSNLEKLLEVQQSSQMSGMVGYLGTTVETAGTGLVLQDGSARASYTLPQAAASTQLSVLDAAGRTVATVNGETGAGRHEFLWNGRGSDGQQLTDGTYTLKVAARDRDGTVLSVTQSSFGRVTGVSRTDEGTSLNLGTGQIAVDDVLSVTQGTGSGEG